jgi:hypothetical protein
MDSIEKLAKFQAELMEAKPEDEAGARMVQLATLAGPIVGSMLPEDPAEVDDYLLKLAAWSLQQRSDDAAIAAAVVVKEGEGDWAALPLAVADEGAQVEEVAPDA